MEPEKGVMSNLPIWLILPKKISKIGKIRVRGIFGRNLLGLRDGNGLGGGVAAFLG